MPVSQTRTLESLPFDVIYQVARLLDDCDWISLSRTSRTLRQHVRNELTARQTVERHLLHSTLVQGDGAAPARFCEAIERRFAIHEAIATAAPYAVSVLAYGADFLYNQGVLCYRAEHELRLLDVHRAGDHEDVFDLNELLRRFSFDLRVAERVTLLHYNDGIVSFRLERAKGQKDALLALDMVRRPGQPRSERLLFRMAIPTGSPIFVRHSRSYIWYGTFTSGPDSSGVWSVRGRNFATAKESQFSRDRVVDGDLGETLCFEMYQEHLYAVSTQAASDDERDSSFYRWFCLSPDDQSCQWSGRLWRREHREGPINELWTDLSIRVDEKSGRPAILECRREWHGGQSENHRTNYIEPLPTPHEAKAWVNRDLDESKGSFAQRSDSRPRRHYHAEYEHHHDPMERHEFIAARTKHRCYHLSSQSYIDIVNAPALSANGVRRQDRLRLRTVSRKRKSPIDDDDGTHVLSPDSDDQFVSRDMQLWPRDDTPAELHRLLCPDSSLGSFRAVSDERSIIYSVPSAGLPPGHQALNLISFDPEIRFPDLPSLRTMKSPALTTPTFPVKVPRSNSPAPMSVQEATPLYRVIRRGYRLRL